MDMNFTAHMHSIDIMSNNRDPRLIHSGPGGLSGNFFFYIIPYAYVILSIHWEKIRRPIPWIFWSCVAWDFFGRMSYSNNPPSLVLGTFIQGLINLLGPVLFIMSAFYMCNFWDHSKGFQFVVGMLKKYAGDHPIAQVMLIGYSFAITVEGLFSGAACYQYTIPFLIALGHSPYDALLFGLAVNGFFSPFGGQTLHMNLGFASLNLSDATLSRIAFKICVTGSICQLLLIPYLLSRIVRFKDIVKSWLFILVSMLSCILPYLGISWVRYEYPALAGGTLSLVVTSIMARYKIGLNNDYEKTTDEHSQARQNFLRYYRYQLMRDLKIKHVTTANELIQRVIEKVQGDLNKWERDLNQAYISQVISRRMVYQTSQKPRSIYQIIQELGHQNLKEELAEVRKLNMSLGDGNKVDQEINGDNGKQQNNQIDNFQGVTNQDQQLEEGQTNKKPHLEPMSKRHAQKSLTTQIYNMERQLKSIQVRREKIDKEREEAMFSKKQLEAGTQTGLSMRTMRNLKPVFDFRERILSPFIFTFPIWGILLVTFLVRTPQIGALQKFRQTQPYWMVSLGSLMDIKVSRGVFLQFQRICDRSDVFQNLPLLGFPFIFPYLLCTFVMIMAMGIFGLQNPFKNAKTALFPTLFFLKNLIPSIIPGVLFNRVSNTGNDFAPTFAVGLAFAQSFKKGAIIVPLLLGFGVGPVMAVQIVAILWMSPMTNYISEFAYIDQTSMFAILVIGVQAATSINFIMFNICKMFAQVKDVTYFKVVKDQWVVYITMLVVGLVTQVLFAFSVHQYAP